MQLDVPYYTQSTPTTCWYHSMKMIRHYHEYGAAAQEKMNSEGHLQKVKSVHNTTVFDEFNGPLAILIPGGFVTCLAHEFNRTSTGVELQKLLLARGPLFVPCWLDKHARVLVGVEANANREVFPDEDWVLFMHDPGMEDGAYMPVGLNEMRESTEYLAWGPSSKPLRFNPDNNNLWYFLSKAGGKKPAIRTARTEPLVREH